MNTERQARVFRASIPDPETVAPYPITLEALVLDERGVPTGEVREFAFTASARPGAGAQFTAASLQRWDPDTGRQTMDVVALRTFLARVLPEDDQRKLAGLLDDHRLSVSMEQLGDVYVFLIEEYSGRPTQQSSTSPNGRQPTGPSSTAPPSLTAGSTS